MSLEEETYGWSEAAVKVLKERYFDKNDDGEIIEDVKSFCHRVAEAVAEAEFKWGADPAQMQEWRDEFEDLMLSRRFLPNSPTLMNAGTGNDQCLSACFVLGIPDNLGGIFDTIKHAAIIHKSAGGTGFSFSHLRPEGSTVGSTKGVSSGPVSFLKIFNAATEQIKAGGRRRGANMAVLDCHHPDLNKFIDCKMPDPATGIRDITNFNISVAATNEFMRAVLTDTTYSQIDPHTKQVTAIPRAQEVMDRIAERAWRTGDPGLVFIDRINNSASNPTPDLETIDATNPCGEQALGHNDACNLGSINLSEYVTGPQEFDWEQYRKDIHLATRFLDNVIEINPFPLPKIRAKVRSNRRIGLGVMGFADLLFKVRIPYGSPAARVLGNLLMRIMTEESVRTSTELAQERGEAPNFKRSIYAAGEPIRNLTTTTVAPTGTISILAGCSSGIEPVFALAYQHIVNRGKSTERILNIVNSVFEEIAKAEGFWSPELENYVARHGVLTGFDEGTTSIPDWAFDVFKTANEISIEDHIDMQAAWQEHCHNAISKTINLPNSATVEDIKKAYLRAYDKGCKGITVFRDGCLSTGQVLNAGTTTKKEPCVPCGDEPKEEVSDLVLASAYGPTPKIRKAHDVLEGKTYTVKAPEGSVHVTLNSDQDGPLEVFLNIGKAGSDVNALSEAIGRLLSMALRLPSFIPAQERLELLIQQLEGIGGSRFVGFGANRVLSLPDAVAKALTKLSKTHAQNLAEDLASPAVEEVIKVLSNGHIKPNLCPKCSNMTLVREEGCKKCAGCGYSECG